MPSLKYIFQNATTKDFRLLRGKTIECISLIGLAVGAEKVRYSYDIDISGVLIKTPPKPLYSCFIHSNYSLSFFILF